MFCIKIFFLEPDPVGAEILWRKPETIFFKLEPEPKQKYRYLVPELMPNGSAPQYWKNFYE